ATYPSDTSDWNPEGEYFRIGRIKSTEGVKVTRVFIIKDNQHLTRPTLLKQITLDLEAGIEIRCISFDDFKKIGCPEDFGIWDNDYIAIVDHAEDSSITGGKLDTRVKSMLTAQNWRDRLIRNSTEIKELKDLKRY
ncbi:MAG TPA: hypothetical protein PKL83_05840, partial [bacterium]|nr:hypothetical protein [bacterium]